jgi:hypothetical protein
MTWTDQPPTVPGYYWCREPGGEAVVVEVYPRNSRSDPRTLSVFWVGVDMSQFVAEMPLATLWCGPLVAPPTA